MIGNDKFNNEYESNERDILSEKGSDEENVPNDAEEGSSMNGRQAGEANVKRLEAYIRTLRSSGKPLPCHNGKPDKSSIALACGFNRQTLYHNPAAIALLESAADLLNGAGRETGSNEVTEQPANTRAAHLQQQMDRRDRRIQKLEVKLQTLTTERDALKKELEEKDECLRQYDIIEEVMMSNGRKFRP